MYKPFILHNSLSPMAGKPARLATAGKNSGSRFSVTLESGGMNGLGFQMEMLASPFWPSQPSDRLNFCHSS